MTAFSSSSIACRACPIAISSASAAIRIGLPIMIANRLNGRLMAVRSRQTQPVLNCGVVVRGHGWTGSAEHPMRLGRSRDRTQPRCHPCLRYDLLPMSSGWTSYLAGALGGIRTPDPQIRSLQNQVDMGRLAATKPLQMAYILVRPSVIQVHMGTREDLGRRFQSSQVLPKTGGSP